MTTKSGGRAAGGKGRGARHLHQKVKTARGRKTSSTRWLQRHLNDPYVQEARARGFRSRAAFKIIELDDQFRFLKPGRAVVDLGCAPGGWTQVAVERVQSRPERERVLALDIQEVEPVPGAKILQLDMLAEDAPEIIKTALGGPVDVVISDMAAATTGHAQTDHLRTLALVEAAYDLAEEILAPGGTFAAKVFQGGTEGELLKRMKLKFQTVKHAKPPSSRKGSPETFVVATGFKGRGIEDMGEAE